jgi:NarL family two-component system response regulator LiaR
MNAQEQISLIIVEDHQIIRTAIVRYLQQLPSLQMMGVAEDGPSAVEMALRLKPNVILMDVGLPLLDGIEATRKIKAALPAVRVLMLTAFDDDDTVFAALAAGADGYCLKTTPLAELVRAIQSVANGAAWLDRGIAKKVLANTSIAHLVDGMPQFSKKQRPQQFRLTLRELEVLELMVKGRSNQEIANELAIAHETAKSHVSSIMQKLVVSDRTQAAVKALKEGMFE